VFLKNRVSTQRSGKYRAQRVLRSGGQEVVDIQQCQRKPLLPCSGAGRSWAEETHSCRASDPSIRPSSKSTDSFKDILVFFNGFASRLGHARRSFGSFAKGLWVECSQLDRLQAAALCCFLKVPTRVSRLAMAGDRVTGASGALV
jgi:hypothetical protein